MLHYLRKFSRSAVLGIALSATVFLSLSAPQAAAQSVYVGGGFTVYTGPVYWWWPIWPADFYWPPYVPTPRFASIAYGAGSDRVGVSYGQWTPEDSGLAALNYCGAADCQSMVWVGEGCASLSLASTGNYGWAYAPTGYQARSFSQNQCFGAGGPDCRVRAWTCSNGNAVINW